MLRGDAGFRQGQAEMVKPSNDRKMNCVSAKRRNPKNKSQQAAQQARQEQRERAARQDREAEATRTRELKGTSAPGPVKLVALIAVVQSLIVIGFGVFLIYRFAIHADNPNMVSESTNADFVNIGTAIFIFIIFGFVILGSIAMLRGKRWGAGAIALVNAIFVPSSFEMMSGGSVALGVAALVSALIVLYILFLMPVAKQWFEANW